MGFFDLRSVAGRFRFFAVLEALSWLGLLIGMAFKYLPDPGTEVGVKIFGPVHGTVFVLFLITALLAARGLKWSWTTTLLALLSSIPPFCTVVFEVWAVRSGKLGDVGAAESKIFGDVDAAESTDTEAPAAAAT